MRVSLRTGRACAAACVALIAYAACTAGVPPHDDAPDARAFYAGRTLTYIVATDPGGMYDTYGRLVGRYLQKHLGLRAVAIRNVPGGGHIRGANEIAAARPDGLTLGTFNSGLIYAQLLGREGVRVDLRRLSWVGKAGGEPRVLVTSNRTPLRTVQDLRALGRPVLLANSGFGNEGYHDSVLLAHALGFEVRFVFGLALRAAQLSMLRGEVEGHVGSASGYHTFVESGYGTVVVRVGDDLATGGNAPDARALVADPHAAQLLDLVAGLSAVMRWTAGPDGIPERRVAALRTAYMAALADTALLEEAQALGIPIRPLDGASLAAEVERLLAQPPEVVARIADILRQHAAK
jgi:tripartite-type tricarboxylate transporter receptor subunit TctC